jgi:hypothetical protein
MAKTYQQKKAKYDSRLFHIYLDSEDVWEYIEMGKNIDELYPEHLKEEVIAEKRQNQLQYILIENEQYAFFADGDYVITDLGRVYNCLHQRFLAPEILKADMYINVRYTKHRYSKLFKQNNWTFNFQDILDRFDEKGWRYLKYKNR